MSITDHVAAMRNLPFRDKQKYLQDLIGPRTDDRAVLHQRALLITALNVAEVWPHRGQGV